MHHIFSELQLIHVTCPLTFIAYEYIELQVSFITPKLNCKANCKTPFFLILEFHSQKKGKFKKKKPLQNIKMHKNVLTQKKV